MSQCARILAVLDDGEPHTMREIHERAGFMRLNSRISELRGRGHKIECWRDGDDYVYRLLVSEASSNPARALVTTTDQMAVRDGDASGFSTSDGGRDREHLSSAKGAAASSPETAVAVMVARRGALHPPAREHRLAPSRRRLGRPPVPVLGRNAMAATAVTGGGRANQRAMSDEQLAAAAQTGDTRAADLLARRYVDGAHTIANLSGYSTPLNGRDDMAQEALHGLYQAIRYYQPGRGTTFNTFATVCIRRWLYTVVRNDTRRRRFSDVAPLRLDAPLADQHGARTDESLDLHDAIADPRSDVVDILHRRQRLRAVAQVLAHDLSRLERACVEMWMAGASYAEIERHLVADEIDRREFHARAQSTPVKVVDNALARARRKIVQALEDQGIAA